MKKSIKITFEFEADSESEGIELIKEELFEVIPSVIKDGEVFIDSFEIEDINTTT